MSRLVLIDDTNPSIQYVGPWFEVNNTQNDIGTNGPPFQNTLHGVNVTASFSFNFSGMSRLLLLICFQALSLHLSSSSGSAVIVYGTSITTNVSGAQDPTWECYIDSTSIGWSLTPTNGSCQNNWILCGVGPTQLQDGPHVLTVNANVLNQQTFWFDQIQYAPSANVSLNQSLLRIDPSDPAIQYGPGWTPMDNSINYTSSESSGNISYTQTTGATLIYKFSGSY
jgi:hypothetical protein